MKKRQAGFTIIEVMIATMIFTVVLLICLEGITRIGRMYYKGLVTSQIQEVVRNLSDEFSQQIQFGSKDPSPVGPKPAASPFVFCVGDYRYRAVLNVTLGATGSPSVLKKVLRNNSTCNPDAAVGFEDSDGAIELVPRGVRLLKLQISDSSNGVRNIAIKAAYGDEELFDFPAVTPPAETYEGALCKVDIGGSQFCAISELSTTVFRRVR